VNRSQGHTDELLTDIVIASLHTDTQTYQHSDRHTDRQTDRQSAQVLDDSEVVVNQSQAHTDN